MSGYPDEPRDFNDRDDRDRRDREPDRRDDEDDVRIARSRVSIPAIGLVVVGALTIFACVLGLVQLTQIDRVFDDMVKQTEANPNIPAAQKQDQIKVFNDIRDMVKTYGPAYYGVGLLAGAVVLGGGLCMRVLGSPALVIISSLLAMVPFSGCCVLGVVFGIWAMVALGNPEVKAGYAAKRRLAASPDSY
jgi:hypothetical protein